MRSFQKILIYHVGAIGDVMLASPTAASLRKHFPDAHITQISHDIVLELIGLSGSIDSLLPYRQAHNYFQQRAQIVDSKPDLIVDLTGSPKSNLLTRFCGAQLLQYRKQPFKKRPIMHAVDNFLATLDPLKLTRTGRLFPTLTIPPSLVELARKKLGGAEPVIACVPGVGTLRSHRAWPPNSWVSLVQELIDCKKCPVLLGGKDEEMLCRQIASATGAPSFAGQLSLPETAAVLQSSQLAIACDTGPMHIAVAVGTPVIGLHGPTFAERSGPYGYLDLHISVGNSCVCTALKSCRLTQEPGPGYCMNSITVDQVLEKVESYTSSIPC